MGPTQEQIKEFWEGCGIDIDRFIDGIGYEKMAEIGHKYMAYPIDLNNLFKYAVPKLMDYPDYRLLNYQYVAFSRDVKLLRHSWGIHFADNTKNKYSSDDDPAIALFWALWALVS